MEIEGFVGPASRLILKMVDPALEHKRLTVSKMAKLTPLEALTDPLLWMEEVIGVVPKQ